MKEFFFKPLPDFEDLKRIFGTAANPKDELQFLNIELKSTIGGVGTPREQQERYFEFMKDPANGFLDAFKQAKIVTLSGRPQAIGGKCFPDVGVWVRKADADTATAVLKGFDWCKSVESGNGYTIGDTLHRSASNNSPKQRG